MRLLRHYVVGLILFVIVVGLFINVYSSIENNYSVTKGDVLTTMETNKSGNIIDQFNNLLVLDGIKSFKAGVLNVASPTSSVIDIVGGFLSVGIGAVQTLIGLIFLPISIISIIVQFYTEIPSIITEFSLIILIYFCFVIVRLKTKEDV